MAHEPSSGRPVLVDRGWCGRDICPFPFPQRLYIAEPWLIGLLDPLIAEAIHENTRMSLEKVQECLHRTSTSLGAAGVLDVMGLWKLIIEDRGGVAVLEDLLVIEGQKLLVERVDEALRLGLIDSLIETYSRLTGLSHEESKAVVRESIRILRNLATVRTWRIEYGVLHRLCSSQDVKAVEELAYRLVNGAWGVDRGRRILILVNQNVAPTEGLDREKLRSIIESLASRGFKVNKAIANTLLAGASRGELELAWFTRTPRKKRAEILESAAEEINTSKEWRCVLRVETPFKPEEEPVVGFYASAPTIESVLCCLEHLQRLTGKPQEALVLRLVYNHKPGPVITSISPANSH